jgi:hypothetical protein
MSTGLILALLLLSFLTAAATVALMLYKGGAFILWLASKDEWLSPVRFLPLEGSTLAVMRGSVAGKLHKLVGNIPGHKLVQREVEISTGFTRLHETVPGDEVRIGILAELGVFWTGFFKKTFSRDFEYLSWEKLSGKEEHGLITKKRTLEKDGPFVFFQTTMAVAMEVYVAGNFTVRLILVFPVEIWYWDLALFTVGAWDRRATSILEEAVRELISDMDFDRVRKLKEDYVRAGEVGGDAKTKGVDAPTDLLQALERKAKRLLSEVGVKIPDIRLIDFELTDEAVKVVEAIQLVEIERNKANAAEETARGIRTLASAEGFRIERRVAAYGSGVVGASHHHADAIQEFKGQALSVGTAAPGHLVIGADVSSPKPKAEEEDGGGASEGGNT